MPQTRGYLLGRLFARLAQHDALEQPVEQLYQQASTTPPQVIPKALATLIGAGKEAIIFPIMQQLPLDAFDGSLNRREQGAFALGYTHERANVPMPMPIEEVNEAEHELTERYEFRIEPQMKEWIRLNGGGTFIRSILRREHAWTAQPKTAKLIPEEIEEN